MPDPIPFIVTDLAAVDYDDLLALWQSSGLPVRPAGRDAASAFARQMADGHQRVVGLRAGTRLVAAAVLTHDGRKGWINRLAVDPVYRRRGLASLLIAEAERWFQEIGLEVFAALIEDENAASLALFDALGYHTPEVTCVSKRLRPTA
jgi:ribosomal protein S18 acetylase RimI-like enzyme